MATQALLLLLGISAVWAADCPCDEPDVNYCPPTVRFSPTAKATCTSFGRGHINTFDGLAYDFRELGDFWLVSTKGGAMSNFFAQVRQASCTSAQTQTVPITDRSSFSATCNHEFVFGLPAEYVSISHTLNSEDINVIRNSGTPGQSTVDFSGGSQVTLSGGTQILAQPVKYLNPYANLWRDQQPYLNDADFYVKVTFTNGVICEIYFYSSGEATIQIHLTNPTLFGNLGGLCGFPDGCAANDLYLLANPPYRPSEDEIDDAAQNVATVKTTGGPGLVLAGALVTNDQFIAKQTTPTNWVPLFAAVWRISQSARRFSNNNENFNIREYTSSYSTSSGSCKAGYPSFLDKACAFDASNGGDPDGFDKLSSLHAMLGYCMDYCTAGFFLYHNAELQPYHCNAICQYPENPNIDINTMYDGATPPPVVIQPSPGGDSILFNSALNLAGTYTLNLTTTDFCESRLVQVTRTITCSNFVSAKTPQTRYVQAVNGYGGWPRVWLKSEFDNSVSRLSWIFLEWAGQADGDPAPIIGNAISAFPYFTPTFAGTYVLQLALYNGCNIKRLNFTVVAECASCAPQAQIDVTALKEIIWGMDFDTAQQGPVLNVPSNIYPGKPLESLDHATDAGTWGSVDFMWAISDDNFTYDPLERVVMTNVDTFSIERFNDTTARNFAIANPNGLLQNVTNATGMIVTNAVGLQQGPPLTLGKLLGPINTQYGVYPPQREADIKRNFFRIPNVTTTTNWTIMATTLEQVFGENVCILSFDDSTQDLPTLFAFPQSSGVPSEDFVQGSKCERKYNLNLTVGQRYCNYSSDVETLNVECGPNPEVYIDCVQNVYFNFPSASWPTVSLSGANSMDPYGRSPLEFNWQFNGVAPGSNRVNGDLCAVPYSCLSTATFQPDAMGSYSIGLAVSNGCGQSVGNTTVQALCTTPALTAGFNSPPTIPYLTGSTPPSSTPATLVSTATTASGGVLVFTWGVAAPTYPSWNADYTPPPIPPVGFNLLNPAQPILTPTISGSYQITQSVTHGCGQRQNATATIQVNCDQQIVPSFSICVGVICQGTTAIITWVAGGGFPLATINSAVVWTPVSNPPPLSGPYVQNLAWYVNGIFQVTGLVFNHPAGTTTAAVQNVSLIASDGCQYLRGQGTITYVCLDKVVNVNMTTWPTGSVTSGTVLNLDASGSSTYAGLTYRWVVVAAPARSTAAPAVATAFTTTIQPWVMTAPGEFYKIQLTVCDPCSCNSTNVTFTVSCNYTLTAKATIRYPVSGANEVTWASNAFARVEMDGAASNLGGRMYNDPQYQFIYTWNILSAPQPSIYYPGPVVATSPVTVTNGTQIITDGDYVWTTTSSNMSQTSTSTMYQVFLVNSNLINPATPFPTCMYADLAGNYQLQFTLQDRCQVSTDTTAVIQAACGGVPTISAKVYESEDGGSYVTQAPDYQPDAPSYNVSLSRNQARRVVFDASGTYNYTNSRLSFYYAWASPDPRFWTNEAQDGIDQPYGPIAAIDMTSSGYYYVNLTVHDGCNYTWTVIKLYAGCSEALLSVQATGTSTVTTGQSISTNVQTFFIQESSQEGCAYTNAWVLANFTEAKGAAATIRPTVMGFGLMMMLAYFLKF